MIIKVSIRNDETGVLDGERRDGDIMSTKLDSEEGTLGGIEKKTSLFIKIPDPPNIENFRAGIVEPEYGAAASAGEDPPVRHYRKYRIEWRTRFSAQEIALIESVADQLPDGPTASGGDVSLGVVSGLFTYTDIIRK